MNDDRSESCGPEDFGGEDYPILYPKRDEGERTQKMVEVLAKEIRSGTKMIAQQVIEAQRADRKDPTKPEIERAIAIAIDAEDDARAIIAALEDAGMHKAARIAVAVARSRRGAVIL